MFYDNSFFLQVPNDESEIFRVFLASCTKNDCIYPTEIFSLPKVASRTALS